MDSEKERIDELLSYGILDTDSEQEYDNLTQLASQICGTNISLISLVDSDRQWFKSKVGLDISETPRDVAFCNHAIQQQDVFIVENAKEDDRFKDNPLVTGDPNITFYAGVPLTSDKGNSIGTLCVIDQKPLKLSEEQLKALRTLASQTMNLIQLRKSVKELKLKNKMLMTKNEEVENFASHAAHDLKSPINTLLGLIDVTLESGNIGEENAEMIEMMRGSCKSLQSLINDLLQFARMDEIMEEANQSFETADVISNLKSLYGAENGVTINFDFSDDRMFANKEALSIILINLITNSIKYCDKEETQIQVVQRSSPSSYTVAVTDNGPGIPKEKIDILFQPFKTLQSHDRFGEKSTGIGLAKCNQIIERLGGEILVDSIEGQGCTFEFTLAR